MEQLEAIVESTVYRNEENGYSVVTVQVGRHQHTVVGNLPELTQGEQVVFTGQWVEHTQYGTGKVVEQKESVLTIDYSGVEKKQKLPFVVAGGFLSLNDPETETKLVQMDDLDKQKSTLEKEMHYIESLLNDLNKI